MKSPKTYTFESANMGDIIISISGEYWDGAVDLETSIDSTGDYHEWTEVDPGGVAEVFEWLSDKGAEFKSDRSLWFNFYYVADVMIDRCSTEAQLFDETASKTAEELKEWRELYLAI